MLPQVLGKLIRNRGYNGLNGGKLGKRGEEKIFLSENTDGIVLLTSQNVTVQCCWVSLTHPIQQIFAALSFISQQLSAFLIPDRKRFVKEVVLRI